MAIVNATIRVRAIESETLDALLSMLEDDANRVKVIEMFETPEPRNYIQA